MLRDITMDDDQAINIRPIFLRQERNNDRGGVARKHGVRMGHNRKISMGRLEGSDAERIGTIVADDEGQRPNSIQPYGFKIECIG
ncbi:MAG: hypothetical protein HUU02_02525 [Bacteroidetes bacterium]|nr:hypothetical protein [Bacteroidota bacterium]